MNKEFNIHKTKTFPENEALPKNQKVKDLTYKLILNWFCGECPLWRAEVYQPDSAGSPNQGKKLLILSTLNNRPGITNCVLLQIPDSKLTDIKGCSHWDY